MIQYHSTTRSITFDLSYHETKQITLCITDILFIEYNDREIRLTDWQKNSYRLSIRSLMQLKAAFFMNECIHLFYYVRNAFVPFYHIERLKLTTWNEQAALVLHKFIVINLIPLPVSRVRDYYNASKC